jgi:hypothetical protein
MSKYKEKYSSKAATARKRRKRHYQKKLNDAEFEMKFVSSLILMVSMMYFHTLNNMCNREENVHRKRKDIERDIFLPLGEVFFRRSYRMTKSSFYELHHILKDDLEAHFFPKDGGSRDINENPYLIKTEGPVTSQIYICINCLIILLYSFYCIVVLKRNDKYTNHFYFSNC